MMAKRSINKAQDVSIQVTVTNTGSRKGDMVVQCYVHRQQASVVLPVKQLAAFRGIALEPGESKVVSLLLLLRIRPENPI